MGQQGEDLPLTEDVEKDNESNSELENIIELKSLKAKAKSGFTKARCTLLVLIQQRETTLEAIQRAYEILDVAQVEAMEAIEKLSERYRAGEDYNSSDKLGQEIEKIEI